MSSVFKTVIEPSLERIPVLEVSYKERLQGCDYVVTQIIQRNVFTDFDRKLSLHLAATRGAGFPAFTVAVRVNEQRAGVTAFSQPPTHHASVPHALKGIANRAFAHCKRADLTVHGNNSGAEGRGAGVRRKIGTDEMEMLDAALTICDHLGEAEFLDISGDFDIILAGPPGELKPIIMHLQNGSVSMPCSNGEKITPFECPIHGFAGHAAGNILAQGYLARARHALVATKEAAVLAFRAAAETRILAFDRALAGRPLDGYRLDAAVALVKRLKAGLGDSLNGLSEDAQITALDWSAAIAKDNRKAASGISIILGHGAAARA